MGKLRIAAIFLMLMAVMFVGCNLLVDILCAAIDPRLRNRGQA